MIHITRKRTLLSNSFFSSSLSLLLCKYNNTTWRAIHSNSASASTSPPPKVLLSIHGYPRRYNAGSEVYTQTLALGLAKHGVPVSVFAREENPFLSDYVLHTEQDPINPNIPVHIVNHARSNIRYKNDGIDKAFRQVLEKEKPDIVHIL